MTGNGVTVERITVGSVNGRVDKMVPKFNQHTKRIQALERAYAANISENMKEYAALIAGMDELIVDIHQCPVIKRQYTVELAELKDKIIGVKEALDDIEATLYLNVTSELDDNNEPAYTNPDSRKAALRLAKRANDEYQNIKAQLDKLGLDKARLNAQLREIEDTDKHSIVLFRGCVARVQNVTARISL